MAHNFLTSPPRGMILYDLKKDIIKEELYFNKQEFKRQQRARGIKECKGQWRKEQT